MQSGKLSPENSHKMNLPLSCHRALVEGGFQDSCLSQGFSGSGWKSSSSDSIARVFARKPSSLVSVLLNRNLQGRTQPLPHGSQDPSGDTSWVSGS